MAWLDRFPTTNARVLLTLAMALATGVRVVGFGWSPPEVWLLFLTGWAGLDVVQFGVKRATYKGDA